MKTVFYMISLVISLFIFSFSGQNRSEQKKHLILSDSLSQYFNDPTLLKDTKYNKTVFNHIRSRTLELLSTDSSYKKMDNQWNTVRMNVALTLFTDQTVRDYWIHSITKNQIENLGIKNTEEILRLFYSNCTNASFIAEIKKLYKLDVESRKGHTIMTYKVIDGFKLDAHVFYPPDFDKNQKRPAILLFHGGSWYEGKCDWMFGACKAYADKGMVAIAIEYRLYDRHTVPPFECVSDAKSAIRWARTNAEVLGINPEKIAARGFSAGGHLVACTAMLNGFESPGEDTTISSSPDAMIFVSSCFDPTLDNWFVNQVEKSYPAKSISPNHNVRTGLPPSIVIHATADRMCPFWTAEKFSEEMNEAGNDCELIRIENAGHFFVFEEQYRELLAKEINEFLVKLGYIKITNTGNKKD